MSSLPNSPLPPVPFYTVLSISDIKRLLRNARALTAPHGKKDSQCVVLNGSLATEPYLVDNRTGARQLHPYDLRMRTPYTLASVRAFAPSPETPQP